MSFIKDSILESNFCKETFLSEVHDEQKYNAQQLTEWVDVLDRDIKELLFDLDRVKYALSQINLLY